MAEAKISEKEVVTGTEARTRSLTQKRGKGGRPAKDRNAKRVEIDKHIPQQQSNKLML